MTERRRRSPATVLIAALLLVAATVAPVDAPVADAAMRGDAAAVRALLIDGADANAAQGDGMTALHWAAMNGNEEIARMLIHAGARLEAVTRNGNYTPLHLASRSGHEPLVRTLLGAGANPHAATTTGGATPLHFAAGQGNAAVVAALIEHGALVDDRAAAWQQTPLMWAAAYDRVEAIAVLLEHGADVSATSAVEDIPEIEKASREAAQRRNRRMAALRAAEQPQRPREGAANEPPDSAAPKTAADSAAARPGAAAEPTPGDSAKTAAPEPANAVAAEPANPPEPKADSAAPADSVKPGEAGAEAAKEEPRPLSYGELVGRKGGLTPLLFAVRQGNVAAVEALLDAGAAIDQVSAGDHTSPLLMATINGHFDMAMLLLERGADPRLASDAGATPLYATLNVQWAPKSLYPQPTAQQQQSTTHLELMRALLDAGADPNARLTKHLWYMSYNFDLLDVNTAGATPFWRAAYATDVEAMRLLIAHGADPNVPTEKPAGRRGRSDDSPEEETKEDPSGLPPIPVGGPGVWPIHAASGVGYGEGYAANAHRHAPGGWLPAMKYLIEELGADVNARDHNGYNAIHHAAARGDNELILYLVDKGVDVTAISRKGQTTADMANGPVQRVSPFPETVALLERLGSKNNNDCKSC